MRPNATRTCSNIARFVIVPEVAFQTKDQNGDKYNSLRDEIEIE
jgi:hypothetical protein